MIEITRADAEYLKHSMEKLAAEYRHLASKYNEHDAIQHEFTVQAHIATTMVEQLQEAMNKE